MNVCKTLENKNVILHPPRTVDSIPWTWIYICREWSFQ